MSVDAFSLPNAGAQAVNDYFSIIDGDISVMSRIAAAFAPHESSPPTMTVTIDAGPVFTGTAVTEQPAQTSSSFTAPTSDPRIDRVVIDRSTGLIAVLQGVESATPVPPGIPLGYAPVAQVALQPSTTTITNAILVDERVLAPIGSAGTGLINIQRFTANGTYTPTPGTNSIIVEVLGGGAGGGGCAATGAGQASAGGGGGAGSYAKARLTSGFSSVSVTVGAGVAAGAAGAAGANGNASSFGALVSAPGGKGGTLGPAVTPPSITWGSNSSDTPTGANLLAGNGQGGGTGFVLSTSSAAGGRGGTSFYATGSSGSLNGNPGSGNSGVPSGAGGGGACNLASSAARAGGAGGGGLVIVYEYA